MDDLLPGAPEWAAPEASLSWLQTALGFTPSAAPCHAGRQLEQSDVLSIDVERDSSEGGWLPCILKRIDLATLRARPFLSCKPEPRWRVSIASYENEAQVLEALRSGLGDALRAFRAPVPRVWAVTRRRDAPGAEKPCPRYAFLMERLHVEREAACMAPPEKHTRIAPDPRPAWHEVRQLSAAQARQALAYLARFHAFWWCDDGLHAAEAGRERAAAPAAGDTTAAAAPAGPPAPPLAVVEPGLFAPGGWWRKPLRAGVPFESLPAVFASLCEALPPMREGGLDAPEHHAAMQAMAEALPSIVAAAAAPPLRTLLHGDAKTSNLFLAGVGERGSGGGDGGREGEATGEECAAAGAVGGSGALAVPPAPSGMCIDFQWTGPARSGAGDVAYLLAGGVAFDALAASGAEEALLRHYYGAFAAAVRERTGSGAPAAGPSAAAPAAPAAAAAAPAAAAASASGLAAPGELPAFPWSAFLREFDLELLDYGTTALPYLLRGLTPEKAAVNAGRYGWLTHEYDPRASAWLCARLLAAFRRLSEAGDPCTLRPAAEL